MTAGQIRRKYFEFFISKGHKVIPPAPLIPENDPTTLFTSSGMQQLVPYLKGKTHPMGKRLLDSQPCFRAEDIEEVGDNRHTTFFEMLGNWSLGDYFKKDQLSWIWEFLTGKNWLRLPKEKLHVTLFKGSKEFKKDGQSLAIWRNLGVKDSHIHFYGVHKNWWSRSGVPKIMPAGEIGGPNSEIFYEFTQLKHQPRYASKCHPNCDCGRFLEIGNSVFMQYEKQKNGAFKPLPRKNVDFGGGLERLAAASQDCPDIFETDIFRASIKSIEKAAGKTYQSENQASMQIIADHLRAAKAMIKAGLTPSNKQQGYILRRLIRRTAVKFRQLTGNLNLSDFKRITSQPLIIAEIDRFQKSLAKGLKLIEKTDPQKINAQFAFDLFQSFGFPLEITQEILTEKGLEINLQTFAKIKKSHQEKSRTASAAMFKGGLADHSQTTTRYHTATHLLHQALRDVLGDQIKQAGSNITSERLRFDFTHPRALTKNELAKVEAIIKQKIKAGLAVTSQTMSYRQAIKSKALAFFKQKYPQQVIVYSIGDYSRELCGGPHIKNTSQIGKIKIVKQKALGHGLRRLYLKFV